MNPYVILALGMVVILVLILVGIGIMAFNLHKGEHKTSASTDTPEPPKKAPKKSEYVGLIVDVLWVSVGLVVLNWFCAKAFNQTWGLYWNNEAFWATQLALVLTLVGIKNTGNSIGKTFCYIILALVILSIGSIFTSTIKKSGDEKPAGKTVVVEEYARAGEWTKPVKPSDVEGVSNVDGLMVRLCTVDPVTGRKTFTERAVVGGNVDTDYNVVSLEFKADGTTIRLRRRVVTP